MDQQTDTQATAQDKPVMPTIAGNPGQIGNQAFAQFFRPILEAAQEKMNPNQLMALHMGFFSGLLSSLLVTYGWDQTHETINDYLGGLDKAEFEALMARLQDADGE